MAKSQRTKGAAGERELAALLSEMFDVDVKRKLGQARDSGDDMEVGLLNVEVKRRKTLKTFYAWVTQVMRSVTGRSDRIPVVAFRADNERWMVAVPLSYLVSFAKEVNVLVEMKHLRQKGETRDGGVS